MGTAVSCARRRREQHAAQNLRFVHALPILGQRLRVCHNSAAHSVVKHALQPRPVAVGSLTGENERSDRDVEDGAVDKDDIPPADAVLLDDAALRAALQKQASRAIWFLENLREVLPHKPEAKDDTPPTVEVLPDDAVVLAEREKEASQVTRDVECRDRLPRHDPGGETRQGHADGLAHERNGPTGPGVHLENEDLPVLDGILDVHQAPNP